MITSLFSRTQRSEPITAPTRIEKESIYGVVDLIEYSKTSKEATGVLLCSNGYEFEYRIAPDGNILEFTGPKAGIAESFSLCKDYLKEYYGKNEIDDFKKIVNGKLNVLNALIQEVLEKINEIKIPEPVVVKEYIPQIEEMQEDIQRIEESFDEEYQEKTFQDFSDEDLASHALKVLSGEIAVNG